MFYTITESKYVKPVKTKYGEFLAYEITVADKEGLGTTCQLLQKPETPEPMEGGQIHGVIEDSDFGFKFKKTQPEDGSPTVIQPPHKGGSEWSSPGSDTQNQIIRQSSLKVAADLCIANQRGETLIDISEVIEVAEALAAWATSGTVTSPIQKHQSHESETLPFDEEPKS